MSKNELSWKDNVLLLGIWSFPSKINACFYWIVMKFNTSDTNEEAFKLLPLNNYLFIYSLLIHHFDDQLFLIHSIYIFGISALFFGGKPFLPTNFFLWNPPGDLSLSQAGREVLHQFENMIYFADVPLRRHILINFFLFHFIYQGAADELWLPNDSLPWYHIVGFRSLSVLYVLLQG